MATIRAVSVLTLLLVIASVSNVECTRSNFYKNSCPKAEQTISNIVTRAIQTDKRVGAGLLRLLFHDCFVQGCDASVLIDSATNSAEKSAVPNQSLHSLEVIDQAKAAVEAICQRTVSCADIVAFAAATSVAVLGGPRVDLEGGRFDGLVSTVSEANSQIPSPFSNLTQLQSSFGSKGLTTNDLVFLSGAHTIGKSHCGSVEPRLRNFSSSADVDPSLNPKLASSLKKKCPVNSSPSTLLDMDPLTPTFFDNAYYRDVRAKRGLFTSDAALVTGTSTQNLVKEFAANNTDFSLKFAASLFRMGQIGLKTSSNGNIRTNCRSFT